MISLIIHSSSANEFIPQRFTTNKGMFVMNAFFRKGLWLVLCLSSAVSFPVESCMLSFPIGRVEAETTQDGEVNPSTHSARTATPSPVSEPADKPSPSSATGIKTYCFMAKWCGPCSQMASIIDRLNDEGLAIETVDVDDDREMVKQYNVNVIPLLLQLQDGNVVNTIEGKRSESDLRNLLTSPAARKVRVTAVADCHNRLEDRELQSHAPRGLTITNANDWDNLRKAWMIDESAVSVDFDRQFLLVGTTEGSGIGHRLERCHNGNLEVETTSTADYWKSGFTYAITVIDRDGITAVNGRPLLKCKPQG